MGRNEADYYSAPIELLKNFLNNTDSCLIDILQFVVYSHSLKLNGSKIERFNVSADYFGVTFGNVANSLKNGESLHSDHQSCKVFFSINKDIYWDFHNNEKSEFEKVCLLAFLALRSILGTKPYCKITNEFLLSRMGGFSGTQTNTPEELRKYSNEYQINKIKRELRDNWGLIYYGRYTRGFYVSFNLSLNELVFQVEKKRKSTKEKQYQNEKNQALLEAQKRLFQQHDQVTTKTRPI